MIKEAGPEAGIEKRKVIFFSWNDIVQLAVTDTNLDDLYFIISQRSGRGRATRESARRGGRGSGSNVW